MAGRKQHHIPRMVLRGFTLPSRGRIPKVQVYSKQKSYPDSVDNVAAERHFYSEVALDGAKTLDDLITDYESQFASKFFQLRDLPVGSAADAALAAEVVGHLTIRNAYVRSTLSGGIASLFDRAIDLFCDEKNLRQLLGVDANELPERIRERLDETFLSDPRFKATGLPQPILYKMAFMAMKENFNQFLRQNLPSFLGALQYISSEAPQRMRREHNAMLAAELVPDQRAELLRALTWSIEEAPAGGSVLPDCVALGFEDGCAPQPLIGANLTKIDFVVFPVMPRKFLVGKRSAANAESFSDFNTHAAACSHSFFVSHRTGSDLDSLMPTIGQRPRESLEEAINSAFHVFAAENLTTDDKIDFSTDDSCTAKDDITAELTQAQTTYSITFKGIADEETAHRIAALRVGFETQAARAIRRTRSMTEAA